MQVQLYIKGYLNVTFSNVHTGEVITEEDLQQGILDSLQQGEYVIGFDSKSVFDINDLENPIYKFNLEVTENVEYDFDEE